MRLVTFTLCALVAACSGKDTGGVAPDADTDTDTDADADTDTDTDTDADTDSDTGPTNQAPPPVAAVTAALAGDELGTSLASPGDVDGDGRSELLIGASGVRSGAGAAYLIHGPIPTGTATSDVTLDGDEPGDGAGAFVHAGADVTGDGVVDLAIGAFLDNGASGAAYIVSGAVTTDTPLLAADAVILGAMSSDYLGHTLALAPDLTGDGAGDVLLSAYGDDTQGSAAGAALVVAGPVGGSGVVVPSARLLGTAAGSWCGYAVAAGDLNGDGTSDAVVSAPREDLPSGDAAGVVVVAHGPLTGDMTLLDAADARWEGAAQDDELGQALVTGADSDGDGTHDLLIGATEASGGGVVHLVLGGGATGVLEDDGGAHATFTSAVHSGLGRAMDFADIDGDGSPDVLIGAPGGESADGAAFAVYGPISGVIDLDTQADWHFVAPITGGNFGASVTGAGDTTDNGRDELAVGAPLGDTVYLFSLE